ARPRGARLPTEGQLARRPADYGRPLRGAGGKTSGRVTEPTPQSGDDKTSVLFATIAAGGGHVATANAMAEELHRLHPGAVSTRVSDVMAEFGFEKLDKRHKESWREMLK